jgi:hypothetical protein
MNEYIKNMPAGGVLGNPPLSLKSDSTRSFNIKSGLSVKSGVWNPLDHPSFNTRWVSSHGVTESSGNVSAWAPVGTKTGAGSLDQKIGTVKINHASALNGKPVISSGVTGSSDNGVLLMNNATEKIFLDGKAHGFLVIRFPDTSDDLGYIMQTEMSGATGTSYSKGMRLYVTSSGGIRKILFRERNASGFNFIYFSHDKFDANNSVNPDWFILEFSYDSGPEMIINGSAISSSGFTSSYGASGFPANISAGDSNSRFHLVGGNSASPDMEIAEAIFYDAKLSTLEATNIRQYLSSVYDINVD